MTTAEQVALARRRLTLALSKPEGAYEHIGNAIQLLLSVEQAFDHLGLMDNADGDVAAVREGIRAAEARCFRALFELGAEPGRTK